MGLPIKSGAMLFGGGVVFLQESTLTRCGGAFLVAAAVENSSVGYCASRSRQDRRPSGGWELQRIVDAPSMR